MLMALLLIALVIVLTVMVVGRRWIGRLSSLATLLAAALAALWLGQSGLLPGPNDVPTMQRPASPPLDR